MSLRRPSGVPRWRPSYKPDRSYGQCPPAPRISTPCPSAPRGIAPSYGHHPAVYRPAPDESGSSSAVRRFVSGPHSPSATYTIGFTQGSKPRFLTATVYVPLRS